MEDTPKHTQPDETQEQPAPTLLDRIAQRRMAEAQPHAAHGAGPLPGQRSRAVRQVLRHESNTDPLGHLRARLERSHHGAGSSSYQEGRDAGDVLRDRLLHEKIERENPDRPELTPAEIIERLKSRRYLDAEVTLGGARLRTTEKGLTRGVTHVIRSLPMTKAIKNEGKTVTFSESDLAEALQARPCAMNIFLYEHGDGLTTVEKMGRMVNQRHLDPVRRDKVDYYRVASDSMEQVLQDVGARTTREKGSLYISYDELEKQVQKRPADFEPVIARKTELSTEEIIAGLVRKGMLYTLSGGNGESRRMVRGEGAAELLESLGVTVGYGKQGDREVTEASLRQAVGGNEETLRRCFRGMQVKSRAMMQQGASR